MEFLKNPDWHLLIVWYFFLGGIAGGAYFTAAIADNFGGPRDRQRGAHRLHARAAPHRPVRDPAHPGPRHAQPLPQHDGRTSSSGTRCRSGPGCSASSAPSPSSRPPSPGSAARARLRCAGSVSLVGTIFGFFLASYTGVLLSATALPFWSEGRLMGALFLASGASTGMAAISLLLFLTGESAGEGFGKVKRADRYAMVVRAGRARRCSSPCWARRRAPITSGHLSPLFWGGLVVRGPRSSPGPRHRRPPREGPGRPRRRARARRGLRPPLRRS